MRASTHVRARTYTYTPTSMRMRVAFDLLAFLRVFISHMLALSVHELTLLRARHDPTTKHRAAGVSQVAWGAAVVQCERGAPCSSRTLGGPEVPPQEGRTGGMLVCCPAHVLFVWHALS